MEPFFFGRSCRGLLSPWATKKKDHQHPPPRQHSTTSSIPPAFGWPTLYASVLVSAVFGVLSMVAALAVAVPATLVTWITVVVLLAFFGKPKRALVLEGRKVTEIVGLVCKVLLKEGNVVDAVCAVLGYFVLVNRNDEGA